MHQMVWNISQILKLSKGDLGTPTLSKKMTVTNKDEFIQAMHNEIKGMGQHGTCTITYINSVTGAHILSSTWDFKVKRFPYGRLQKFKARLFVRGDIQVEGVDYFEKYVPVVSCNTVRLILILNINQVLSKRQVDYANDFSD